jgi:hypothetical protein
MAMLVGLSLWDVDGFGILVYFYFQFFHAGWFFFMGF